MNHQEYTEIELLLYHESIQIKFYHKITPISGPTISLKLFKRVPKKNCLSAAGPSQGSNFNRITQSRACVIRKWENINGDERQS